MAFNQIKETKIGGIRNTYRLFWAPRYRQDHFRKILIEMAQYMYHWQAFVITVKLTL
jgi:hypothetical protein